MGGKTTSTQHDDLRQILRHVLRQYITTPPVHDDPVYTYHILKHLPAISVRDWRFLLAGKVDAFSISMTSQRWRPQDKYRINGIETADWRHTMSIFVPKRLKTRTALMFIMGQPVETEHLGSSTGINNILMKVAALTHSVIIWLGEVPNQGIEFPEERGLKTRFETELFAYTLSRYMEAYERQPGESEDGTMLLTMPMVKSVVRAMDTVQDLHYGNYIPRYKNTLPLPIDDFILVGASKRGQTAWLTAAVDTRVKCFVPIVCDMVNLDLHLRHIVDSYGYFPDVWASFEMDSMSCRMHSQAFEVAQPLWNAAPHRDTIHAPRYIVNAAGCEYFAADGASLYQSEFPDNSYFNYVPNSFHRLVGVSGKEAGIDNGMEALLGMISFCTCILAGKPLPRFHWQFHEDGSIEIQTPTPPKTITLWEAVNPESRDFRITVIGQAWKPTPLLPKRGKPGTYIANPTPPKEGWKAAFVQIRFRNPLLRRIPTTFTTPINVLSATTKYPVFKSVTLRRGANQVPVTILRGTPSEMGLAHGQLMKEEIHQFVPPFLTQFQQAFPHLTNQQLDQSWASAIETTRACNSTSRLQEELDGIAQGAQIDPRLLQRANAAFALIAMPGSAVAATRRATPKNTESTLKEPKNSTVMGACWHWPLELPLQTHRCVFMYIPKFGLGFPHAVVTFPGMVTAPTGINFCGLMLAATNDPPPAAPPPPLSANYLIRLQLHDANSIAYANHMLRACPLPPTCAIIAAGGRYTFEVGQLTASTHTHTDSPTPDVVHHFARHCQPHTTQIILQHLATHHGAIDPPMLHNLNHELAAGAAQALRVVYTTNLGLIMWLGPEEKADGAPTRINLQEFLP